MSVVAEESASSARSSAEPSPVAETWAKVWHTWVRKPPHANPASPLPSASWAQDGSPSAVWL